MEIGVWEATWTNKFSQNVWANRLQAFKWKILLLIEPCPTRIGRSRIYSHDSHSLQSLPPFTISPHSLLPASENSWNEIKQKFQFLTHKNGKNVLIFSHSSLFPCCIRRNSVTSLMLWWWQTAAVSESGLATIVRVSFASLQLIIMLACENCEHQSSRLSTFVGSHQTGGRRRQRWWAPLGIEKKRKWNLNCQSSEELLERKEHEIENFPLGNNDMPGRREMCFIRWNAFFWLPFLFSKNFQIIKHLQ